MKKIDLKQLLLLLPIAVAMIGAGGSYYFYSKYQEAKASPDLEAKKKTNKLIASLDKLIELPKDETPTIATIFDKEKLKNQIFFDSAENGDVLFVYTTAMKAILYRPSNNKIINVAPINVNQQQELTGEATKSAPAPTSAALRIAYYNGTKFVGLSGLAEKVVREKYADSETISLSNASKDDFKETLVIDLSGLHGQEANDIAQLLSGKVGALPSGETKPDADVLIISGK